MIANSVCVLCKEGFTFENKPTLDRIDNKKGHSLDNCQLTCASCNVVKSNRDEELVKLQINLRKFALMNNLPMTLSKYDYDAFHIIRKGITGG